MGLGLTRLAVVVLLLRGELDSSDEEFLSWIQFCSPHINFSCRKTKVFKLKFYDQRNQNKESSLVLVEENNSLQS